MVRWIKNLFGLNKLEKEIKTLKSKVEELAEQVFVMNLKQQQEENPVKNAISKEAEKVGITPEQLINEWFYGKESESDGK